MQKLIDLDKAIFKLINGSWSNPIFDTLMPWLRNPLVWLPLYIFLISFLLIKFRRQGIWIIIFAIITASITDSISSHIFKPFFNRLRPCADPDMAGMVRLLLDYTPRNGSFTSSHAANHFGIAMFLYVALKKYFNQWLLLFFAWAFIICYAQIYVGVHYPIDILGGAALGCLVGGSMAYILNRYILTKKVI